jgi:hypothetical protein
LVGFFREGSLVGSHGSDAGGEKNPFQLRMSLCNYRKGMGMAAYCESTPEGGGGQHTVGIPCEKKGSFVVNARPSIDRLPQSRRHTVTF